MKKLTLILLLTCAAPASIFGVDYTETYFKFKTPTREMLDKLSQVVSIDNVKDSEVFAYANDRELARFENLGIAYEVLPHPGTLIIPRMAATKGTMADWDAYPTYEAYVAMMYQFETDYPSLCRVVDIGATVDGRSILFARISNNVDVEEDEPEVMHTSSMHGDETTGFILCLRLIDSLLAGYGTNAYITRLIDSTEIWINPLANPDGAYYSGNHTIYGARRYNTNGVDLNRNFPDPLSGDHPDGNPWQPEAIAMMNLAEAHSFVISVNHHGGAEVINYPWDTWPQLHADNDWYIDVCLAWAASAQTASPPDYMSGFDNGITNGYAWYRVAGGRQDYMNYWRGCREITAELSDVKLLSASLLPTHWDYNKIGMLEFLENALYGVRGIVTDNSTGLPAAATIRVLNHDMDNTEVFTDPDVGDYHRMLSAGTYDLEYVSLGYEPQTIYGIAVIDGHSVVVDVALDPLSGDPALAFDSHTGGLVRSGDDVSMTVTLVNDGGGNATGVSGVLQTADSYLSITQNTSAYPTIPGLGGTAESSGNYAFSVAPDCPANHNAAFQLDLTGDAGYAETASFDLVVNSLVENFEVGDFSSFPWQLSGAQNWSISFLDVSDGSYSARSGTIADNQSSQLTLPVEVALDGRIWFDYKVSSEASYDYLTFLIDGALAASWSGEDDWTTVSFDISAGPHTLAWVYEKDAAVTSGQDRAWLDRIIFPALVPSLAITTSTAPNWTVGQLYTFVLGASGVLGGATWSDKFDDLAPTGLALTGGGLLYGTPLAAGLISFTAEVADGSGASVEQVIELSINDPPQISATSLPDATRNEPYVYQLEALNGTPPLIWSDAAGDLAGTGLSLSGSGLLSGTPLVYGIVDFTVEIEDAAGAVDSRPLSLEIIGSCCEGIVSDANNIGGDEPTIGDISVMIDMLYISGTPLVCYPEADTNQSGGIDATREDITIGDISVLIDNLFISRASLPECL